MKTDYSPIWKQADKSERAPIVGLDKRIYDKFRNFSTLMIVRKMEQAGPDRNLDDETHELTARLLAIGYDWHWDMNLPNNAIKPVPAEPKSGPKSLPWPEKVAMLSINPDAASIADVAQLASELINCHQQDAIKTREINALVVENRALIAERDYLLKKLSAIGLLDKPITGPGATCEIGVTKAWVHSPILGVLSEKVSVLLTNQELEDIFVALESYSWSQTRKQRCRAIILRIRPYLQRQVDEIRFSETRSEL